MEFTITNNNVKLIIIYYTIATSDDAFTVKTKQIKKKVKGIYLSLNYNLLIL